MFQSIIFLFFLEHINHNFLIPVSYNSNMCNKCGSITIISFSPWCNFLNSYNFWLDDDFFCLDNIISLQIEGILLFGREEEWIHYLISNITWAESKLNFTQVNTHLISKPFPISICYSSIFATLLLGWLSGNLGGRL